MSEIYKFNCENFTVIEDDPRFLLCEFYFGLIGENRSGSVILEEDYENSKGTVGYTPICGKFFFNDFMEHEPDETPLGTALSFADSQYGYKEYNGKKYATTHGIIFKEYLPKEAENILRSGEKKISIEIDVKEKERLENGKFRFKKFTYHCITILGARYLEGMQGAHLEVKNARRKYAKFIAGVKEMFANQEHPLSKYLEADDDKVLEGETNGENRAEFGKYDELDFTIPEGVKAKAEYGLELRKKYKRGGTSVGLNTARYLINNKTANPEKVRHISKYFPRHMGDNLDDTDRDGNPPSNGYIAFLLWGGYAGKSWSEKLVKAMDRIDGKESKQDFADDESVNINEIKSHTQQEINKEGGKGMGKEVMAKMFGMLKEFANAMKFGMEMPKFLAYKADTAHVYALDTETMKCAKIPFAIEKPEDSETEEFKIDYAAVIEIEDEDDEQEMSMKNMMEATFACMQKYAEAKEAELATMKAELDTMAVKCGEMESKFAGMESENNELKEFKAERMKKEREMMAHVLYKKYEEFISEEEKTELNKKLFAVEKFDDFQKEVFSLALPKIESKLSVGDNKNSNQSDFNFSMVAHLMANDNKDTKPLSTIDKLKQI